VKTVKLAALALLCAALAFSAVARAQAAPAPAKKAPYKILHVMSYHSPMRWADGQFAAFKEAMAGVPVEYRVFRMEANLHPSKAWAKAKGREASELIAAWKPDLVYATDDDAQEHLTRHYVGKELPFVVSGVNKDPADYGFVGSKNVAGVLEPVHIVETLRLLQAIVPHAKRFAIVSDESPSMLALAADIRREIAAIPGAELVAFDVVRTFDAYQRAVLKYQGRADALWPLGVHGLLDARGKVVPREVVMRWTAENSRLPDAGFWSERVEKGTLVAVTVSSREQGLAAGRMAHAILVGGKSPAEVGIKPDAKGVPMVSLARANKLGLKVRSSVLLSAEVIEKFDWDKKWIWGCARASS
jgi:ABC-type uncharacterized transport system substrate-binding protein